MNEKKKRIPIDDDIRANVLFDSNHTCCKCRDAGKPIQIHHLDENPSNNKEENLAVLCLFCHDETMIKGGFGRKLSKHDLLLYKKDWLARVSSRREEADKLAVSNMVVANVSKLDDLEDEVGLYIPLDPVLFAYLNGLPSVLESVYKTAHVGWDTGITSDVNISTQTAIDVLTQIWIHLSRNFPENHFSNVPAEQYISAYISARFEFRRALSEPDGIGTGGTMAGMVSAATVLSDLEDMIVETVEALAKGREGFSYKGWVNAWNKAKQ